MSYRKYDPVWKRWETVPSAVDDAADVMSGYETQLSLNLNKPADATPEERFKNGMRQNSNGGETVNFISLQLQ